MKTLIIIWIVSTCIYMIYQGYEIVKKERWVHFWKLERRLSHKGKHTSFGERLCAIGLHDWKKGITDTLEIRNHWCKRGGCKYGVLSKR